MLKNNFLLLFTLMLGLTGMAATGDNPGGAEKVEKILADLAAAPPSTGSAEISITESDFNSWLEKKSQEREYIRSIKVGFHENNEADLYLDLDISKYKGEGYYAAMLSTMFEDHQLLKATGKIKVVDRHFSYVINSLSINEVIVTPALVAPLVAILLPDYDLAHPLELPYGITDIKTAEGILTITR